MASERTGQAGHASRAERVKRRGHFQGRVGSAGGRACGESGRTRAPRGTVKLSRICPFCRCIPLELSLRINDLEAVAGGENAAKQLNLTVPLRILGLPTARNPLLGVSQQLIHPLAVAEEA